MPEFIKKWLRISPRNTFSGLKSTKLNIFSGLNWL